MTKPVRTRKSAPWAWEGAAEDRAFWLGKGAETVLDGHALSLEGVELPPLWRWFDRSSPVWREPVARLFCRCGAGPVGDIARVWQQGREPVAEVRYQQREHRDDYSRMLVFRAVVHRSATGCDHGSLILHDDDAAVVTHCRVHDLTITGQAVARAVGAVGGWEGDQEAAPPRPRRVVLR